MEVLDSVDIPPAPRVRVDRGNWLKLYAMRRYFSLGSTADAAAQSIIVHSDRLADADPVYAQLLADVCREAEAESGGGNA